VSVVFLLAVLFHVMPPPMGDLAATLVLGRAYGLGQRLAPLPVPRPQSAPAGDCNCGVPASPRGPR
jgi:hypothetical protein